MCNPTRQVDIPIAVDKKDEPIAKIEMTSASLFSLDKLIFSDKTQPRTELLLKYVDFSAKYGMGYKLSNG